MARLARVRKQPDLKTRYAVGIDLVRSAVNKGLMAKGYVPVDFTPDFYVTLFLGSKGMTDVTTLDMGWYTWGPYSGTPMRTRLWCRITPRPLILDIVDAKTNKLAWRPSATTTSATRNNAMRMLSAR